MMREYKDPAGVTRTAVAAVYTYMALDLLATLLRISRPADAGIDDIAVITRFLALLACAVMVGRWIYRTNSNAHAMGFVMSITPGWAIGWFFVPFANLIMPYQGVQETWEESHHAAGLVEEADTSLLRWWWGLWIAYNIVANVAAIAAQGPDSGRGVYFLLLPTAVNIALCLVLVRLMQRLSRAQDLAVRASAFG
jgi:hypothetical protein